MDFDEYQKAAEETDQSPLKDENDVKSLILPLLGLAGESGTLLTHYKRYLRDGEGYAIFKDRIGEELGDILWNVSNIATKANLSLGAVAMKNLAKIKDRWHDQSSSETGYKLFDENCPLHGRFPREFEIEVDTSTANDGKKHVQLFYKSLRFGNELTDNSFEDDGYRLHDVFHLTFMAMLGWSPVMRASPFFNCKRKHDKDIDEVQDGGRAAVIDEAIVALIFAEARKNNFFDKVYSVEYGLLRTIKDLTSHLEIAVCSGKQWENAILQGFKIWRNLKDHNRGRIVGNLVARTIDFIPHAAS